MTSITDVKWRDVESSNVAAVGWCAEGMLVRFHRGGTYLYRGASRQQAVALAYAARLTKVRSVGSFLNLSIKKRYDAERIAD